MPPTRNLSVLFLTAAAALVVPATHAGSSQPAQERVYVAVVDKGGRPVVGLTAADVSVSIDGVAQEVLAVGPAAVPASIVILTDRLGLDPAYSQFEVRRALSAFVKVLRQATPEPQVALTTVDGPVVRLTTFATPPRGLDTALGRLSTMAADSSLVDGLLDACRAVGEASTDRRVIFALFALYRPETSRTRPEAAGECLRSSGASLWAIEVRSTTGGSTPSSNREYAVDRGTALSGGTRVTVGSPMGLASQAARMAEIIAAQHVVTYGPGGGRPLTSQRRVGVSRDGVTVLAPSWIGNR